MACKSQSVCRSIRRRLLVPAPNMSEKHGQLSGAQWTTKSTSAGAAGGATATSIQKNQQPNPNSNPIYEAPAAITTSPYGISGVPVPIPELTTYTSGRFQAPLVHLHPTKSSPLTIAPIVAPPQPLLQSQVSPTPTNVPVPSGGFVPPVFPNMTAPGASTSATTSVLTPNPFAASPGNPGLAFVNAFNFGSGQQLDLGKIMHAMNATNATVTAPSTPGTPAAPVALQRQPQPTHAPHPPHPSESGPVVVPAAAVSGAINSTIAENVMSALSSDEERMRRVQQVIESSLE